MLFDSTLRRELARNFGGTLVVIRTIGRPLMFIRNRGQAASGGSGPQRGKPRSSRAGLPASPLLVTKHIPSADGLTVAMIRTPHVYEVRPRKDKRGVDLICDVLPFGGLWYSRQTRPAP